MKAMLIQYWILAATLLIAAPAMGQSLLPTGPLVVRMDCGDGDPNTVKADTLLVANPDDSIEVNYNILSYQWQGPLQNQTGTGETFAATRSGTYTLTIDALRLSDSMTVRFTDAVEVLFFASCCEARMPNAFTPNGDNRNDIFAPVLPQNCNFRDYQLQIFNRWGKKVFETNNGAEGWNGQIDGKDAPSDVYVYVLTYMSETASLPGEGMSYTPPVIKGDVTLIR